MIVTIQDDYSIELPTEVMEELDLDEGDTLEMWVELINDIPCIIMKKVDDEEDIEEDY